MAGVAASGGQPGEHTVCAAVVCQVVALPTSCWMVLLTPLHTMSTRSAAHVVVDLRLSVQPVGGMGRGRGRGGRRPRLDVAAAGDAIAADTHTHMGSECL